MLKRQIEQCEQQLAGLRSDNIQLESSSRIEVKTRTVNAYSEQEIRDLEMQIRTLNAKNDKLRGVLGHMGLKTVSVTQGKVETKELRDVNHE